MHWRRFCDREKLQLFQPAVQDLLKFLAEKAAAGLGASTINSIRSAMTAYFTAAGVPLTILSDSAVQAAFTSAQAEHPSRPSYDEALDLDPLIRTMEEYGEAPSGAQLRTRCVVILRIAAMLRASDVVAVATETIRFELNGAVSFALKDSKTVHGYTMRRIIQPYLDDARLCPVSNL